MKCDKFNLGGALTLGARNAGSRPCVTSYRKSSESAGVRRPYDRDVTRKSTRAENRLLSRERDMRKYFVLLRREYSALQGDASISSSYFLPGETRNRARARASNFREITDNVAGSMQFFAIATSGIKCPRAIVGIACALKTVLKGT